MWSRNGTNAAVAAAVAMGETKNANRDNTDLTDAYQTLYGLDQLLRVVAYAVFENDLDLFDVADTGGRVTFHHHQIRLFAGCNRADARFLTKKLRAVQRRDLDRFERRKTGLHQQLHLTLIAKACDDAAVARRIEPGQKQTTSLHKRALEIHRLAQQRDIIRTTRHTRATL